MKKKAKTAAVTPQSKGTADAGPQESSGEMMRLPYKRWLKQYKPIKNTVADDASEEIIFETYGPELERVLAEPNNKIWTLVDEGRHLITYAGYHLVNRLNYFICKVPWKDPNLYVIDRTYRFINTETGQPADVARTEKWKLELGAQCNRLLNLAEILEESSKAHDLQTADDLRSIIERVEEADKLEV